MYCLYAPVSFQTLLKTTHHIMVHDVRGSLAHLRSLVQKAITPHSNQCVICSRMAGFLADGSKDDVIVFQYNNYYNLFYSQQKNLRPKQRSICE